MTKFKVGYRVRFQVARNGEPVWSDDCMIGNPIGEWVEADVIYVGKDYIMTSEGTYGSWGWLTYFIGNLKYPGYVELVSDIVDPLVEIFESY